MKGDVNERVAIVQSHHDSIGKRLEESFPEIEPRLTTLTRERDELLQFKQEVLDRRHADRILHHHPRRIAGYAGTVLNSLPPGNDSALVKRVSEAYQKAVMTPVGSTASMWLNEFASANKETHDILMGSDLAATGNLLRDPTKSMLFYGFDSLQSRDAGNIKEWWINWNHQLAYDGLLQLARATGLRRAENPEAGIDFDEAPDPEELLSQLDRKFGFRIDFPSVFAGEVGVQTSRGVANIRAVYALYQAWRTKSLVKDAARPRVLEIGAGLGRAAYYCAKFGITDYTIIDIPLTGVSQGYYLGRLIGEDMVSLCGETMDKPVRILPPVAYDKMVALAKMSDTRERFDLIVNVDSLTEMAKDTAEGYLRGAARLTDRFLSMNHEHNGFTVESLYSAMSVRASRAPCWIRRGYVEEVVEF